MYLCHSRRVWEIGFVWMNLKLAKSNWYKCKVVLKLIKQELGSLLKRTIHNFDQWKK